MWWYQNAKTLVLIKAENTLAREDVFSTKIRALFVMVKSSYKPKYQEIVF